jgi:transportin-3
MAKFAPGILFDSPGLDTAVACCLVALKLIHTDIIFSSLNFLTAILEPAKPLQFQNGTATRFPNFIRVNEVFVANGFQLMGSLLDGLLGNFPEESLSTVISLFRHVADQWPAEFAGWLPPLMQGLPGNLCTEQMKTKFVEDCARYFSV